MIIRLAIAIIVIVAASYIFSFSKEYLKKQPKQQRKKIALKFGFFALAGILLVLIVTGRLHWISAIFAGLIPVAKHFFPMLLRLLPGLLPFYKGLKGSHSSAGVSSGNNSIVQTDYLKLVLDHDTGEIQGEILSGVYAGNRLDDLTLEQIQELLSLYSSKDEESYNLLYAYTERRFSENEFSGFSSASSSSTNSSGGDYSEKTSENKQRSTNDQMTRKEALSILGLDESASDDDIIKAHKKLMQKMHPDRGGSHYLAAKINEAKDFLIQ